MMTHWMQLPVGFGTSMIVAVVNHVWQSTVFAAGVWLLTLTLRRNQARTRYQLWVLASAKFLIPFSLLMTIGGRIDRQMTRPAEPAAYAWATYDLVIPYKGRPAIENMTAAALHSKAKLASPVKTSPRRTELPFLLMAILAGSGTLFLLARWLRSWLRLRAVVQEAKFIGMAEGLPILETRSPLEPGVFGILRPVLLLPAGIHERLTSPQMEAIVAHELSHVRRRDNLTAALHMFVEALFWFYPVLWLIRTRLIEERERACDEAVLASRCEAQTYAEGILTVCKFYMEAPLSCVSGVTGANLKKRIVRIMSEQAGRKLDLGRKLLLALAGALAVTLPISFGLVHAAAQTATANSITDTWQGTLHLPNGKDLRTVVKVTKDDKGALKGAMYSLDQGGQPMPMSSVSFTDGTLKYAIERLDLTYEGKMSADGKSITGTVTQGKPLPLVFERATPETAWAIPEPRKPILPMAADAKPDFEVATIKPAPPDEKGKLFGFNGSRLKTVNTTLLDLITFAYGVQQKQVIGGPEWMSTIKWDVDGQPDIPGAPNSDQLRGMFQKLLADRFQLAFHKDEKEMSAYLLTVSKSGSKMKVNTGDPKGLPGLFFRGLGVLTVTNATMGNFCGLLQTAVLDRPVVDRTGLTDKYDFLLKWTPDESQFGGMGIKVPPPSDAADAPPPLFTALPEQTGLKLDSGKAQVTVLIMDKVEKPSDN